MARPAPPAARLLVVDDQPDTVRVFRDFYRNTPIEVLDADGGRAGLEAFFSLEPDLVVLDLVMPDLDGLEVCRRIREHAESQAIPIVLLTATKEWEAKVEAFAAGADDYVTKPFSCEELDARLQTLLRKRHVYRGLLSQLHEESAKNQILSELLLIDEKTGLPNYRQFRRRLEEEFVRAERYGNVLSLVMMDLDDFKRINDRLGHLAGDRLLFEFAALVRGGARQSDLPARFGGEEFAIILPQTGGAMATLVAERVRAAVEEENFLEDEAPTKLTVSAGVATYPAPGIARVEDLLRAADRALYRAKGQGKNRVVADERSLPPHPTSP